MDNRYLGATHILDFEHASIQALIERRAWRGLDVHQAIAAVYTFVKDEIQFGYNSDDAIQASRVLADGYGQCNTKSSLFMAILRALGIGCRFHGFTIDNRLQKGAIPSYLFFLAPQRILHSWVEVYYQGRWLELEGFIIDQGFLQQIQAGFSQCQNFSGYGIATSCLQKPDNEFNGDSTYIQSEGIVDDFGVFDDPDSFYKQYGSNLSGVKKSVYALFLRHLINWHLKRIRRLGIRNKAQTSNSAAS